MYFCMTKYGTANVFFFSSRRRHTRFDCDWSSDVCSSDFRLHRLAGMPTWYVPNGPEATRALSEAFFRLTDYPVEDREKRSEERRVGKEWRSWRELYD